MIAQSLKIAWFFFITSVISARCLCFYTAENEHNIFKFIWNYQFRNHFDGISQLTIIMMNKIMSARIKVEKNEYKREQLNK